MITVGASFLFARILGQSGFGEYGVVNSTAGMISSMAGLGIGQTVVKYVAELKLTNPERAGQILALSSLVTWCSAVIYGIAFVVLGPWLAEKTLAAPHLAPLLQISAIAVALGVINSVQSCSLSGCEAFKAGSYISVVTGIVQSFLVVLGAWFWGLKGAVVAMAMGMVITVLLTRYVVKTEWRKFNLKLNWQNVWSEWHVLVHYSLPTFLTVLLIGPVTWACNAFLANQPNGYAELGIFNAALQWQGAIQLLPGLVCTALLPIMSEKCGGGNTESSLRVMKGMMRVISLITIPIALVLCVLSPIIMRGYGNAFSGGYWTMVMLVATGALMAIMTPVANFVMASGMMWKGLLFNTGWIVSMLVGSWFLVRWGADGLSASRLLATIIHSAFIFIFVSKIHSHPKA